MAWIQEGSAADGSTISGGSACGRVMLYSLATGTITQVTDGMADVASVCWSADGKYRLYARQLNKRTRSDAPICLSPHDLG